MASLSKRRKKIRKMLERDEDLTELGSRVGHSTFYHRFFSGYSEEQIVNERGKKKIHRSYVGRLYYRDCTDAQWIITKVLYVVFLLAAFALSIVALIQPLECNAYWYTVVPSVLSLLAALVLGVNIFSCVACHRKMQNYHFSIFGKLPRYSFLAGLMVLIYGVVIIVVSAVKPELAENPALTIVLAFVSAALYLAIGIMELKAGYKYEDSGREAGENDIIIS